MTDTFFEYLGWVSLSPNLKESFNKTLHDAKQHRHGTVEIEHLLFALVDDPEGAIVLMQMEVNRDELRDELADHLDAISTGKKVDLDALQPARSLKKLMAKASDLADNEHDDTIDGGDVIRALAQLKTPNILNALIPSQVDEEVAKAPKRHARSRSRKPTRTSQTNQRSTAPKTRDKQMENTPPATNSDKFGFDIDPIRASIKAIMARRADAEQVLNECEWYHLFKSLNMIDEGLEGEEQTHRTKLLARAEAELAERPRCRKAFLYVRHLDKELARLKGIVDIDWAGDFTPDEAVRELADMRSSPLQQSLNTDTLISRTDQSTNAKINEHLFDVKVQESEVLALEQKLMRLDKTAGSSQDRLRELESHLETHDTHSKKRENVISELETYLRSEMLLSDQRDHRITELEKELHDSKEISDSQVDKSSHLEHELAAFKEHAGNREMLISDLEAKLKAERDGAQSHVAQVNELRTLLANEKSRAQTHDKHIEELQKTHDEEQTRAAAHERQVVTLETDLKSRLEQLQAREEHIKNLQKNLLDKENHMQAREEQVKKLEADLSLHENEHNKYEQELHILSNNHQSEVAKLATDLSDKKSENHVHQRQIQALRTQLGSLETRLQDQETAYSIEKVNLAKTIDEMRREIEESESLIEIIHAEGEPYRLYPKRLNGNNADVQIVERKTIPIAAKPHKH